MTAMHPAAALRARAWSGTVWVTGAFFLVNVLALFAAVASRDGRAGSRMRRVERHA